MNNLDAWLKRLAAIEDLPNVHNLYSSSRVDSQIRLANLKQYLNHLSTHQPTTLLVGEAPGYQGTYRTGVPFCSEAILLGPKNKFGLFGGEAGGYRRVYQDSTLWKEPSATIVQRTVDELPEPVLIWSTFPLHPHKPGLELSNRTPNATEVKLGQQLLAELINLVNPNRVIAVGNVADKCLAGMGIKAVKVRHPSHGGATMFHDQLLAELTTN